MANAPTLGWAILSCTLTTVALGQQPVPLADRVDKPLVPCGISERPAGLSAELAYLFKDDNGIDAVHLIGNVELSLGERDGQQLRSRQAVVWLLRREHEGRPYTHLQIFLWQDASVDEIGGTVTTAPALFVTLSTFGKVTTRADDVAFHASTEAQIYRQGNAIRKAVSQRQPSGAVEETSLRVFNASGLGVHTKKPAARPAIYFKSEGDIVGPVKHGDHRVLTIIGGVYLSRGTPGAEDYMEIRAESVVAFLPPDPEEPSTQTSASPEPGDEATMGLTGDTQRRARRKGRKPVDRQVMSMGFGNIEAEAVYLEGDIIMSQGSTRIRASRIYYDFLEERALILDAVIRTTIVQRNIPLYMRAAEIKQLSANHYSASDAILTTDEFHTPHYHIGATRIDLANLTPADPTGESAGITAGSFRIQNATLNLSGTPVAYWPYIRGNIDTSETAIKNLRTGYSDDFGLELETDWHLFNVMNLETPAGFDATLNLDIYTERGPGIGVDVDYTRERYFGELKSYLLTDDGTDFLGRDRDEPSQKDIRGRFLWRHRQYLDDDWQLSFELAYISDRGFLEEYFESEFDNGKEQESLIYLKKQRENWAFTALMQTRLMDSTTVTERLPDFGFFIHGHPLSNTATWYSENRAGLVRYRPADQTFREFLRDGRTQGSGAVARGDTRQEISVPFDLGPIRLAPFIVGRTTAWDDSPEDGGLVRTLGTVGIRGSMYLSKVYPEARSSVFDIDSVRHIIKPDIVAWTTETNHAADDLFPFDDTVEQIDQADGVTLGLRQRWQTKRGEGDTRRIVDFLTLDVEAGFFNDVDGDAITNGYTSFSRPENSIAHNFVNSSFIWRLNDRTALLSELNYDINDGQVDILNVSLAVERTPRLSYLLGYRFIDETDSNLLGFDMNYQLTEKHTFALRERFDLDESRTLDFTVAFIRKMPR